MKAFFRVSVVLSTLVLACGSESRVPPSKHSELEEGLAAVVGDDPIAVSTVERVAEAQRVTAERALDRVLGDALMAARQRERPGGESVVGYVRRAVLARQLLEQLEERARALGPPTAEETERVREKHWAEVDRPELRRSVHAVAIVADESQEEIARRAIERLRARVADARDEKTFFQRLETFAPEGIGIRVERLTPVARDGTAMDPERPRSEPRQYAPEFVDAVYAIDEVGDLSPVVRTSFGFHVILLTQIYEERRLPDQELVPYVITDRTERARSELLERLRRETTIHVERAAMELTKRVKVAR